MGRNTHHFYESLRQVDGDRGFGFVPVIPHDLPRRYMKAMARAHPKPVTIAVGKVVPSLFPLRDQRALGRVISNVLYIKELFPSARLHVFGVGGFATAALLYLFVDSTDTTGWIHDARFAKVRRLGGGISRKTRPTSLVHLRGNGIQCRCPACAPRRCLLWASGVAGFKARAIHNAWVLCEETRRLNAALDQGALRDFVTERTSASPWHRAVLRAALDTCAVR